MLLAAIGLAACGGGGGETPPTLIISEVASNFSADDSAWLEIYNPSDAPIALAAYQLRTGSATAGPDSATLFALPDASVPAKGLLVIAGAVKVTSWTKDTPQIVYVKNGADSPYWNANGFVELLKDGATADFVRFGNSAVAPLSAGTWNGANVAALPSGALEYGKSIVRPMPGGALAANRRSAADWVLVNFATPAGINDIAAGVVDSDEDGIPDSAKLAGGTYGGLDLYSMGARRGQRDLFMQIDYMQEPAGRREPMLKPRKEALQKVVDAFANSPTKGKPYALHIDVGNLYSATFSPADFNLGGGKEIPFNKCIKVPILEFYEEPPPGCATLFDYKSAGFDVRRRAAFHYVVFGNSQEPDGSSGSSGIAEPSGNDFVVTIGNMSDQGGTTYYPADTEAELYRLINIQASTLMHEFGHNLGLWHGGDVYDNYKPNYISIMNYLHQFTGIGASLTDSTAADRYLYQTQGLYGPVRFTDCDQVGGNPPGWTTLTNSPCSAAFKIDFSDGSGAALDEANIDEGFNVGRGSTNGGYADWNHNGAQDAVCSYQITLNPANFGGIVPQRQILRDFNDWDNLMLPFARHFNGSNNGRSSMRRRTAKTSSDPMKLAPRAVIIEPAAPHRRSPPPAALSFGQAPASS